MKKYSLVTTHYCYKCSQINKKDLSVKLNYNGSIDDLYINFSDDFDAFNFNKIPNVGITKRKDLVYGKIFLLRKFIEMNILNKYEFLLHIDFSDTKFCRNFNELMSFFEETGKEIIISTEKNAWPYFDVIKNWTNKDIIDNEFKFLNSGAVLSRVDKFYNILLHLESLCLTTNIDFWDDQGVWQYYDLNVEIIPKDEKCEYFFSTALLDDTYYTIENKQIKTKFDTLPFLVHDNSSFSLNLIKKI